MIKIPVKTQKQAQLIDITRDVQEAVSQSRVQNGICMVFVPHTTAGITLNECADPSVPMDVLMVLNQIIPQEAGYRHLEGNSAAHIKSILVGASETIAIQNNRIILGAWQGIFFCEFDGPRTRNVQLHIMEGRS